MSSEIVSSPDELDLPEPRGDRDLADELDEARAGYRGIPAEARCVGCRRVRAKLISRDDPTDKTSFKTVCHECGRVTWWNPIRILDDRRVEPSGGDRA